MPRVLRMQNHGAWSEQSNGVWSSQIFLFILGGGRVGEGRESRKGVKVAWGGTKREVGATKAVVSGVAKYVYSGCQLKSTILIPQVK